MQHFLMVRIASVYTKKIQGTCGIFHIIIPLLRHFTIFGQEKAQNMRLLAIHCSVPVSPV